MRKRTIAILLMIVIGMLLNSCWGIACGCAAPYIPFKGWATGRQLISNTDQGVDGLDGAWGIALSPDNAHLYVTGSEDNSVVLFTKDLTDNFSNNTQTIKNGDVRDATTKMTGLGGAREVLVSHDGEYIYVSAYEDDSLVVFSRNKSTGVLSVEEILKNGEHDTSGNLIDGLDGAWKMVLSKDNKHLYLAGYEDDTIVVFERNNNGKLKVIQSIKNADVNVQGIDGPRGIALGSNDLTMYVIGYESGSLAVFARNIDGTLTYTKAYIDGQNDDNNNPIQYMDKPMGLRIIEREDEAILISSREADRIMYFEKKASGEITLKHNGSEAYSYAGKYGFMWVSASGTNFLESAQGIFYLSSARNTIYNFDSNIDYFLEVPREIIEDSNHSLYITGSEADSIMIIDMEYID